MFRGLMCVLDSEAQGWPIPRDPQQTRGSSVNPEYRRDWEVSSQTLSSAQNFCIRGTKACAVFFWILFIHYELQQFESAQTLLNIVLTHNSPFPGALSVLSAGKDPRWQLNWPLTWAADVSRYCEPLMWAIETRSSHPQPSHPYQNHDDNNVLFFFSAQ